MNTVNGFWVKTLKKKEFRNRNDGRRTGRSPSLDKNRLAFDLRARKSMFGSRACQVYLVLLSCGNKYVS